jgi:hypothetical protein
MGELIQKPKAFEVLNPYLPVVNQFMVDSLNSLNTGLNAIDVPLNNRAKANLFHSIAIEKAKIAFKDKPDIKLIYKYQSIQIVFDSLMVGRIKKLNKKNLTSNSKTGRNSAIIAQQLPLFELPEITYIDLGYSNDPIWSSFDKLIVICRLNDDIKWELPFDEDSIQVTLRTEPVSPKPIETETQITIKRKA